MKLVGRRKIMLINIRVYWMRLTVHHVNLFGVSWALHICDLNDAFYYKLGNVSLYVFLTMFTCQQDGCCVWPAVVWSVTCACRQKLMLWCFE